MHSFFRLEFQNFILYNHVNWKKFLMCLGSKIIRETLPLVFCQNLSYFVLCILWSFNLILFYSFEIRRMYITKFTSWTTQNIFFKELYCSLYYLCFTNVTHRKKDGRKFCVEVFSQGMVEHQTELYTRMVKTISLGMPKAPNCTYHTLRFHTSKLHFPSNI